MQTHIPNPQQAIARIIGPGSLRGVFFRPDGGDEGGTGGGSGDDKGGDGDGKGGEGDKPVAMTQKDLDALIDRVHGRATTGAEKKARDRIAELERQLAEAKGAGSGDGKGKGKDGDGKGGEGKTYTQQELDDLLNRLEAKHEGARNEDKTALTQAQEQVARLKANEKAAAIRSAAAREKAIDPDLLVHVLGGQVKEDDDGNLVVVDSNTGKVRLGAKGKDMTLDELVAEHLAAKPYLKQGSGTSGAGSGAQNNAQGGGKKHNLRTFEGAQAAFADRLRK